MAAAARTERNRRIGQGSARVRSTARPAGCEARHRRAAAYGVAVPSVRGILSGLCRRTRTGKRRRTSPKLTGAGPRLLLAGSAATGEQPAFESLLRAAFVARCAPAGRFGRAMELWRAIAAGARMPERLLLVLVPAALLAAVDLTVKLAL